MGRRSKKQRSSEGRDGGGEAAQGDSPVFVDTKIGTVPLDGTADAEPLCDTGRLRPSAGGGRCRYGQAVRFEFLNYDDGTYVSENATIRQGVSWQGIGWSFTSFDGAIGTRSHGFRIRSIANCSACARGWHHAVNVLLHAANSILLFLLLVRMTAATWRSALVAALFALHPLHVESVAWVAERKDVLCTLFAMLAMLAYVRYVARPLVMRYMLVVALFALGLMSKPMLVTLPFVLLLLDYWPLGLESRGRSVLPCRRRLLSPMARREPQSRRQESPPTIPIGRTDWLWAESAAGLAAGFGIGRPNGVLARDRKDPAPGSGGGFVRCHLHRPAEQRGDGDAER